MVLVLLSSSDAEEPGIIATHLGADGQYKDLLYYPVGVSKELHKAGTDEASIMMTGNEVFKVAVKTLGNVATEVLKKAGVEEYSTNNRPIASRPRPLEGFPANSKTDIRCGGTVTRHPK